MPQTPQADALQFREAMAGLAAAVTVITTDGPAGRHGTTATAVTSVTDSPPTLLVCINRGARIHDLMAANGHFCVNVLSAGQVDVANAFANSRLDADQRFAATGPWRTQEPGGAIHPEASLACVCAVDQAITSGTHTIFLGRVLQVNLGDAGPGLVYHRRAYARV